MTPTQEQLDFVESVRDNHLTKGIACAGTGKTSTAQLVVSELAPQRGLYIAFAKSVATEASSKFPPSILCKTIHAYAMGFIPRFNIGFFGYRDISEKLPYSDKMRIVSAIETFFNSSSTCMHEFFLEHLEPAYAELAQSYIQKMMDKEIPATFGFALKYFHLLLDEGLIDIPPYDLIILDEAGDVTGVSLAIFRLLEAHRKLMIGDPHQNIFAFMNTVDGFKILKDEGHICSLTKSFRVADHIAARVEVFCQMYLEKSFKYEGVAHTSKPSNEILYISRTNSAMIGRMIHLIASGEGFTLLREPKEIFALPLAIISASAGKKV